MITALEALLVVLVWASASAAVLTAVGRYVTAGTMVAAAASGALLALHGEVLAGSLLGGGGIAAALVMRQAAAPRAELLPAGSAPVITLCVVTGALAIWIGGTVFAGPGGTPSRTAVLVLLGLGAIRLIAAGEERQAPTAALLLGLGLGFAAGLQPGGFVLRLPVLALALAAAIGAGLTFAPPGSPAASRPVVAAAAAALVIGLFAPDLAVLGLAPLVLSVTQLRAGKGAHCLRSAALAAGLLGVATLAGAPAGGERIERLAAVAAALAAAAVAGVLPHLMEVDDAPASRTAFVVRALVAPALVMAILLRVETQLPPGALSVLGGVLLAAGALNVVWGLSAGFGADRLLAWRASYLAEWGLAFLALGLLSTGGAAAALLVLLVLVLLRLPPSAWIAAAPDASSGGRARGVVLTAALGGAAPFAGFAARVLLLRGATALAWPLALGIGAALVVWLPASWRLSQSLRRPRRGRADLAQIAGLVATAAIGLYPVGVLRPLGLG